MHLKKYNNTEGVELSDMGLTLKVKPHYIFRALLDKNSQEILDRMIEKEFSKILRAFDKWEKDTIKGFGTDDDPDAEFDKHRSEVHIKEIQDVADFSMQLVSLHSDWEDYLFKHQDLQEMSERAYMYWRYNKNYGWKPSEETKL